MFEWLDEKGIVDFYFERSYVKDRFVNYKHGRGLYFSLALSAIFVVIMSLPGYLFILPALIALCSSGLGCYIQIKLDEQIKLNKK